MNVRQLLAKAAVMSGRAVEESSAIASIEVANQQFENLGAVVPAYDPESLLNYVEITPHLRPSIDAMAHNIDGYGYTYTPIKAWMKDLESEEATEAIAQAIEIEQWVDEQQRALEVEHKRKEAFYRLCDATDDLEQAAKAGSTQSTLIKYQKAAEDAQSAFDALDKPEDPATDLDAPPDEDANSVSDQEIDEVRQMLQMELRREGFIFDAWFANCCSDRSFVQLRRDVREDIKSHGWGCIEFMRNHYGELKRLSYIPGYTIRPMVDPGELVDVAENDSVTPLSKDREVLVKRRFSVYVQIMGGRKVYFKSPRDPRVVSRTTGKIYKDLRALRRPIDAEPPGEGPDATPANELLYLSDHDPRSPTPPPVWIGNLVSVLGGREADETNYFYLADKAIPAGLVFVHGGRVPKGTRQRLESRIKNELAGARGTGKFLVVEAIPSQGGTADERSVLPSVTFQSLRDAQTSDALFTTYDERTSDRIGASFRLSPMLRGYTPSSLNRATAYAAMEFSEQQVFQPEREEFDWIVNRYIMPEIGIRFLRFKSNSPPTRSAEEVGKLIQQTAPHGAWTPNEAREVVGDVMNTELAKIEEAWADEPMVLTLAQGGASSGGQDMEAGDLSELNHRLRSIENRVSSIVTEELRAVGYEVEGRASFIDEDEVGNSDS